MDQTILSFKLTCNKLKNLCLLGAAATSTTIVSFLFGFKSFIITRMIDFFIYYVLSKQKLK